MNPTNPDPKIIFGEALALASQAQRAAYLDQACAGDADLRREVREIINDLSLSFQLTGLL